jgi:hypothetical protein
MYTFEQGVFYRGKVNFLRELNVFGWIFRFGWIHSLLCRTSRHYLSGNFFKETMPRIARRNQSAAFSHNHRFFKSVCWLILELEWPFELAKTHMNQTDKRGFPGDRLARKITASENKEDDYIVHSFIRFDWRLKCFRKLHESRHPLNILIVQGKVDVRVVLETEIFG